MAPIVQPDDVPEEPPHSWILSNDFNVVGGTDYTTTIQQAVNDSENVVQFLLNFYNLLLSEWDGYNYMNCSTFGICHYLLHLNCDHFDEDIPEISPDAIHYIQRRGGAELLIHRESNINYTLWQIYRHCYELEPNTCVAPPDGFGVL